MMAENTYICETSISFFGTFLQDAQLYAIEPSIVYDKQSFIHARQKSVPNTVITEPIPVFIDYIDEHNCVNKMSLSNYNGTLVLNGPMLSIYIPDTYINNKNMRDFLIFYYSHVQKYLFDKKNPSWKTIVKSIENQPCLKQTLCNEIFKTNYLTHHHYERILNRNVTKDNIRKHIKDYFYSNYRTSHSQDNVIIDTNDAASESEEGDDLHAATPTSPASEEMSADAAGVESYVEGAAEAAEETAAEVVNEDPDFLAPHESSHEQNPETSDEVFRYNEMLWDNNRSIKGHIVTSLLQTYRELKNNGFEKYAEKLYGWAKEDKKDEYHVQRTIERLIEVTTERGLFYIIDASSEDDTQ